MWSLPLAIPLSLLAVVTGVMTFAGVRRSLLDCEQPPRQWPALFGIAGILLAGAFVFLAVSGNSTGTPEVLPNEFWKEARVVYHLSLLVLLLMITATDLRNYEILDWVCWLGMGLGLAGAVVSGQFQIAHIWSDWNQEIPQLQGPYLPGWLSRFPRLHGLAWSLAGIACGVSVTWGIRRLSSFVLQMPTLGTGDILLMAMVGAYLGWQPTLVALLLAPMLALVIGGAARLLGNLPAIPYGPFLAAASWIALTFWRFFWMAEVPLSVNAGREQTFAVRRFFGDPMGLLIIGGIALALLAVLLGALRVYKSLPVKTLRRETDESAEPSSNDPM